MYYVILSVCCQVITCRLIFDVIKTLVERFAEADIEVLHHVMKGHVVVLYLDVLDADFCCEYLAMLKVNAAFSLNSEVQ